jgi:3-phosphoshikimate 1-carboxyvinyltransferase
MTTLRIIPTKLTGKVDIPSSKSMGHRQLICAALAKGKSIINNISISDDIVATCRALRALGAHIDIKEDTSDRVIITVSGGCLRVCVNKIDCGESGSTLRFMIPIGALCHEKITFIGHGKLVTRPLQAYYDIFAKQGIAYDTAEDGNLPLSLQGPLQVGKYVLPGNVSSQFISGLLFALPLLEGASTLDIIGPLESEGYIAMTLNALSKYGIQIKHKNYRSYEISGSQKYVPQSAMVEGDFSQAAFWLVAGTLGKSVVGKGVQISSLQGDKVVIDIIRAMGGNVIWDGTEILAQPAVTHGTIIDAANCPDIIPVLTVLAALSQGKTEIINAGRLRIKECDRLAAITSELNKIGARIKELPTGLIIDGVESFTGGVVDCWNDHRIAMSLAVASIKCREPLVLTGANCVAKSYPRFWEDFASLGGRYE